MNKRSKTGVSKKKEPKKPATSDSARPIGEVMDFSKWLPNVDINKEKDTWQKRVLIFTPTTGNVRVEWVQARYGQIIPTNWSFVEMAQFLSPYVPVSYQLADAQNLMAKIAVEGNYEWVLFIEHDNVLPPDAFIRFNEYINRATIPMVSGLYFLRSTFTEPLVYRGRGNSHFRDWKLGDKVWADGVPMGALLVHGSLIKAAWEESPEITIQGVKTREVFQQPKTMWYDPENGGVVAKGGTTDLEWCSRLMKDGLFAKAGWPEFQKMKYPILVDTNIFVRHIDPDGTMWPLQMPTRFIPEDKNYKGKDITN